MTRRRAPSPVLDLFDAAPSRAGLPVVHAHPPAAPRSRTSAASADATAPAFPRTVDAVRSFIEARGVKGATRNEIAAGLSFRIQSVCSAVGSLIARGIVGENPGATVWDAETERECQVVHGEAFVLRWRDAQGELIPRRLRSEERGGTFSGVKDA